MIYTQINEQSEAQESSGTNERNGNERDKYTGQNMYCIFGQLPILSTIVVLSTLGFS